MEAIKASDIEINSECEIQSLLRAAISCIENGIPECAAWRVADALLLLAAKVNANEMGVGKPTGRGAMLKVVK